MKADESSFELTQDLMKNQIPAYQTIKKAHPNSIESMAAHPSHTSFASGSHDHTIKLWDMEKLSEKSTLHDHKEGVWSLDYSKKGQILVSASPDKNVLVWDEKKSSPGQKLLGHKDKVYSAKLNENDKMIASIGEGAELLIWDLAKASQPMQRINLQSFVGYDIAWSKNGQYLFVTARGSKIIVLDSKTFKILGQDSLGHDPESKMEGVCANWSTLPGRIFCSSGIGHIAWYMLKDGNLKKQIQFGAHLGGCRNVELHPHQKYLISTGKDGSVRLWDCNNEGHPQIISNLVGHTQNTTSPIFVGDEYVVTGSWDESIGVWKFPEVKNPKQ